MRILLAEDDIRLAEPLSEFLSREHHSVTWLSDGQQAMDALLDGGYQLALLDWMLPGRDGLSIVRELRRRGDTTLVLMLTARDGLGDMVEGLQGGADDYLVKPFRMGELAARIRSLERRSDRPYQPSQLVWNSLELDSQAGQLWCQGQPISLTSKELQLLEWFLRHPGQLFSRSQLLDRLWSLDASAGEDTVKTHLNNLRRKLRNAGIADRDDTNPIETVHGLGYRLRNPRQ
jgi:DNA-binding response OmpR family regulator